MVRTKNTVYHDGRVVPTPPSTPESRAAQSAACNRIAGAAPESIATSAARNATLENAFATNPNIDEIECEDDTGAEDTNGDNDANGSNNEAYVEGRNSDNEDDGKLYKSSLFNDDVDDDSIDDTAYRVESAKGAGAGRKANPGCPEKPNTDGMSKKESEEALRRWEKSWKHEKDRERRKSAHGKAIDETITYTGVVSDLLRPMTEVKLTPMKVGDNFPTKCILTLRIVEEANLYGVCIAFKRSNSFQVDVCGLVGDTFHVHANQKRNVGWSVSVCQKHIDGLNHPTTPTAHSCPTTPVATPTAEEPTVEDNTEDEHNFKNPFEEIVGEEGNPDDMQLKADVCACVCV